MNSRSFVELSLPVQGMNCTSCAARVEKAIRQLPGVSQVDVDLPAEVANITYDPHRVDLFEFQHAVMQAGYKVPTAEITFNVNGMSCLSCSSHVGSALGDLVGVLQANVNLNQGTAQVTYVPTMVTLAEMEQAVTNAGYHVSESIQSDQTTHLPKDRKENNDDPSNNDKLTWRKKLLLRRS